MSDTTLFFGAYKSGNTWRLTEDPVKAMEGEDQVMVSSPPELMEELRDRHPAPSDLVTYLQTYDFGRSVQVNGTLQPTQGTSVLDACKSVPGLPLYFGRSGLLRHTRLNSNRGHIGDSFFVRYDKNTIVYDPELVKSEKERINQRNSKKKTGRHAKWVKGQFTNQDLKPHLRNLEILLEKSLTNDIGNSTGICSIPGHWKKTELMDGIYNYLRILLTIRTIGELDLQDNDRWIQTRNHLRNIGKFLTDPKDCPHLTNLISACSMVKEN